MREHGIVLLGSTILGLEHHTPENIVAEIEHAIAHETDLHQFMLYTPVPGTPLYSEMEEQGRLLDVDLADIHGQDAFNFQHAAISREESREFLGWAFRRDFERNGPSLFRICRTTFEGWKRYKNHPDLRVRERFHREARLLRHAYAASPLGHGAPASQHQPRRGAADARPAQRDGAGVRIVAAAAAVSSARSSGGPASARSAGSRAATRYDPATIIGRRNWETSVG